MFNPFLLRGMKNPPAAPIFLLPRNCMGKRSFKAADEDAFESVAYAAAEKLGIEII